MIAEEIQLLMAILMVTIMEQPLASRHYARYEIDLLAGMFVTLSSFMFTLSGPWNLRLKLMILPLEEAFPISINQKTTLVSYSTWISFETQNINRLIGSFFEVIFSGLGTFPFGIVFVIPGKSP